MFRHGSPDVTLTGLPHSEIPGSTLLCSSPGRIAAYASFVGNLSLGIRHTPSLASYSQLYRVFDACFASILKKRYVTVKELSPSAKPCLGLAARRDDTSAHALCQALGTNSDQFGSDRKSFCRPDSSLAFVRAQEAARSPYSTPEPGRSFA